MRAAAGAKAGWAILAAAALLQASCGPHRGTGALRPGARPIRIGVGLISLTYEYVASLDKVIEAKAKAMGVELIVVDAQQDADRQVRQIEGFIAQKVDAIILNPCAVEAASPAVDKARAAGVPVVNVNSETRSAPTAFIGSDDLDAGRIAMGQLAKLMHGQGGVVMIHGYVGQAAEIKRTKGAQEILAKNPGMHLLAEQTAEWDRAKAMSLTENWIQSLGPRIGGIFAQNDEMAMGAVLALEQAGLKRRVFVVGVDAIHDALQAIRDGRLEATVFQDAQGQGDAVVETAVKIVRGEPYEKQILIPFQLVTRDNLDRFQK